MTFGDPNRLLAVILPEPLSRNKLGHPPLDDFDHLSSRAGLNEQRAGKLGFAWAKLTFVAGWPDKIDGYGGPN